MKLLILQLSDIHIKSSRDAILTRTQKIADAVRSRTTDSAACLIALTGDIAYSGDEEQYLLAIDFVRAIQSAIIPTLNEPRKTMVATIPGNHDLDFTDEGDVRGIVLSALRKKEDGVIDE